MASKRIEDEHSLMLKQLLADYGLECQRSASVSLEEEEELEPEVEDEIVIEEEAAIEEAVISEEKPEIQVEEEAEEVSREFPTPSLRRVVPEKLRRIEAQNRINVLPDTFAKEINPALIPKINSTAQQKYIDILAEMVGCTAYKSNLAEYWFLDTLANLLRRAQEDEMHRPTQAILILWFCEWMKEMQQFDAADRQRMLKRWKDNMLSAARTIAEEEFLPTPTECGVYYSVQDEDGADGKDRNFSFKHKQSKTITVAPSTTARSVINVENSKQVVDFADNAYECSLQDLTKITHYIYDLFSTDYQYDLVRSIFCFTPEYRQIDPQFQLRVPKRIYAPLKPKAKPSKSPKKEKPKSGKGKKQEPDSEEYILLMQFIAKDLKAQEEQEERDRENWNKRSHILPLNFAATEDLFNMYWPPPPELIVELPPDKLVKPSKGKK